MDGQPGPADRRTPKRVSNDSNKPLAEEAAQPNPDIEGCWNEHPPVLAEEAAQPNPDHAAVKDRTDMVLAEEAAQPNPDTWLAGSLTRLVYSRRSGAAKPGSAPIHASQYLKTLVMRPDCFETAKTKCCAFRLRMKSPETL